MKHKKKLKKLEIRQKEFDDKLNGKKGYKRPGSQKKSGY